MTLEEVYKRLKETGNPKSLEHMVRFGITPGKALGVRIPDLRQLAKEIGRDHDFALRLWDEDTRETRILAAMTADPKQTTSELMEEWTAQFDYWEICDQCVMNLFEKTEMAWGKAVEYAHREEEFFRRTGFVLMARLAVSDKKAPDSSFEAFLPLILNYADDDRNMVKKAINWALRQTGKRNIALNKKAIAIGEKLRVSPSKAARWVASDALKELRSEAVQKRLKKPSI